MSPEENISLIQIKLLAKVKWNIILRNIFYNQTNDKNIYSILKSAGFKMPQLEKKQDCDLQVSVNLYINKLWLFIIYAITPARKQIYIQP